MGWFTTAVGVVFTAIGIGVLVSHRFWQLVRAARHWDLRWKWGRVGSIVEAPRYWLAATSLATGAYLIYTGH
jgi:hypothetical protein